MSGVTTPEQELLEIFRRETLSRALRAGRRAVLAVIGMFVFFVVCAIAIGWPLRGEDVVRALGFVRIIAAILTLSLVPLLLIFAVYFVARLPTKDTMILRFFRANRDRIVVVRWAPVRAARFWDGAPIDRAPVWFAVAIETQHESMRSPVLPELDAKRAALLFHALTPNAQLVGPT